MTEQGTISTPCRHVVEWQYLRKIANFATRGRLVTSFRIRPPKMGEGALDAL
jgi:hypothetical protein